MRSHRQAIRTCATIGGIIGAAVLYVVWKPGTDPVPEQNARLLQAQRLLAQGELDQASAVVTSLLDEVPANTSALFLAGTIAEQQQRPEAAVERFLQVLEAEDPLAIEAGCRAAQLQRLSLRQLSAADATLKRVRQLDPQHPTANRLYSELLLITGRRWESRAVDLELIRSGEFTHADLVWYSLPCSIMHQSPEVSACLRVAPRDPLALLGDASPLLANDRSQDAETRLRRVLQLQPDLVEAHAQLGRSLADQRRWREMLDWNAALPEAAHEHPDVWSARGAAFLAGSNRASAVHCFLEALRRDPDHREAVSLAAGTLHEMGHEDVAQRLASRAQQLDSLVPLVQAMLEHPDDMLAMRETADLCLALGRLWEAWGWSEIARRHDPSLVWATDNVNRLESQLTFETPRNLVSANPAWDLEPDAFELQDQWYLPATTPDHSAGMGIVRFVDEAGSLGINFAYVNGSDPSRAGTRMYEIDGGGAAVLDYDCDGWPDLYLTQGGAAPPDASPQRELDQLYRNRRGSFRETSTPARLWEAGFSQGVTVADYDNDGFDDLYVANIGRNRLFHNEGDGTFRDVTDEALPATEAWTSSCLIADLTGNALPDIYDVNYLAGDDLFERTCVHEDGVVRVCMPREFECAADRVWINAGDGSFRELTDAAPVPDTALPGLGIVAARFDNHPGLELFVANDGRRNSHFTPTHPDPQLHWQDQAVLKGLAFDGHGKSQACMGVACGDADGDGRLDLFVTNFYHETNCLYLAQDGGMYRDATREAGLAASSLELLGFGTQFLDADLDGWLDLVVVNGHLVDRTPLGEPYRMRPRFYRNTGQGRFLETPDGGPFFETERLGRALARLDWNRDGRDDFAVSHLDGFASLVTNHTPGANRSLTVRLCGTESSRDAIGANVTVVTGDGRRLVRQLTAGDGYQCSNQRALAIGLGAAELARRIEVAWPGGLQQAWDDLACDRDWLLIEGRPAAVQLP